MCTYVGGGDYRLVYVSYFTADSHIPQLYAPPIYHAHTYTHFSLFTDVSSKCKTTALIRESLDNEPRMKIIIQCRSKGTVESH